MKKKILVVGLSGGSGSGKSWLASYLGDALKKKAVVMCQDWYYHDHSGRSHKEIRKLNFDHPHAIEMPRMLKDIASLCRGEGIKVPLYDYATHVRLKKSREIASAPIVIIEGLFVLGEPRIRRYLDLSVFIEAPADIRLVRRVRRDSKERRVDLEETLRLYEQFVRPMHEKFIQPSAEKAMFRWHSLEDKKFPKELLNEIKVRYAAL